MNMRYRSQGILRQVSALLITLSDNTFHITEHVLFQKMWERDTGGNINVRGNRNDCELQHVSQSNKGALAWEASPGSDRKLEKHPYFALEPVQSMGNMA